MRKNLKILLLLSNIFLFIFVLNAFVKFIIFEGTKTNSILIFIFCIVNIIIAVKGSIEATEKNK
ncbi:hypothetical protein SAMN05720268_0377 [Polaribacter sp. KT 15]|nr:hypothetical protein SAMN05720268_0377 [Polaribacter sp. KT 15]